MENYLLGIDLGGTNLRVAVVTSEGQLVEEMNVKTESEKGPYYVIDQMIQLCEKIMRERKIDAFGF
jgi:glucokinase